jgi:two-component system LytT family response regulator
MDERIRVIIVDDEPLAREGVRLLLEKDSAFRVIGECQNGRDAVSTIVNEEPDLVFLDVQMPELDGFGVLRALPRDRLPLVVFVTAFDQYALPAFDAHALDYLVKPIDPARFRDSLVRIKQTVRDRRAGEMTGRLTDLLQDITASGQTPPGPATDRMAIKDGERIYFVRTHDIDWIEAADNYANLHTGQTTHLMRATLSSLEERLDPKRFVRIHRSTIVNVDKVAELRQHFQGEYIVLLQNGTRLKLSRSHREKLAALLGTGR